MFKTLICGVVGVLALTAAASVALADDVGKVPVPGARAVAGPPTTIANAKLAAQIKFDGEILQEKGVAFISHTANTGIYCIFPLNSNLIQGLAQNRIAPVVSIDFGSSPDTFAGAQWDSGRFFGRHCQLGTIEVDTLNLAALKFADEGFTIVVP